MSFLRIVANPNTTQFIITGPVTTGSPLVVAGIGAGTKIRVHDNAQRFGYEQNNVYDFIVESVDPTGSPLPVGSPIPPTGGAFYTVTIASGSPLPVATEEQFLTSIPDLSSSPTTLEYIGMIGGWYDINKFDGTLLADIPPFTINGPENTGSPIDANTSLNLPGRGVLNYGELLLEDLVWLLENFAGDNSPSNPLVGQIWFDTSVGGSPFVAGQLKVWNGTTWAPLSGAVLLSQLGDVTFGSPLETGQVLTFDGSNWTNQDAGVENGVNFDEFIASGAETTVSTTNVTTQIKTASTSYQQVFLNGVLLREGLTGSPIDGGYHVSGSNEITIHEPYAPLSVDDEVIIYAL